MVELREHSSRLEIPPDRDLLRPFTQFISKYAEDLGVDEGQRKKMLEAAESALLLVINNNEYENNHERIAVDVYHDKSKLVIEVVNRGVPFFLKETDPEHARFSNLSRAIDQVEIQNRGREGQTIILTSLLKDHTLHERLGDEKTGETQIDPGEIEIREILPGEEVALSKLFYFVYGYQYINDFVYYPEKIKKLLEEKKLISMVAAAKNGRLIGHVGLLKWGDTPPVYEPCLGVVDPGMKSKGLFSHLFQQTMGRVEKMEVQYLFFDFVTNHDLSQRFVSKFGASDLALFVGCQSKHTQAKLAKLGLGQDSKEMDRYTLLYSVISKVKHPFGKTVFLPGNLGEMLGFLLKPLNLSWTPAPRFQLLKLHGEYQTHLQPLQNAVIFDLFSPGRDAVDRILSDWRQYLREGYQYCAVEVPLEAPGVGNLYDILSEHGFFVSGFIPYHHSDKLGFRFQSIGHTKVAFDDIKVCTESAKRLLQIVRTNYERNALS